MPTSDASRSTPAGDPTRGDDVFVAERARLVGLAYRMLGSHADAEDVVADVYLRWRGVVVGEIANPAAYLTTMVTRHSIDRLRAQSRRREQYVGPWLPEPVQVEPGDPADAVLLAESLTLGFLSLLDRLDPLERAAYLLREIFGESYATVAAALERSEDACRQLVSRARRHVSSEHATWRPASDERRDELLTAFLTALASGDLDLLRRQLTHDVVLVSDGGPDHRAARHPIVGRERTSRFLSNLYGRLGPADTLEPMMVNSCPAMAVVRDGAVVNLTVVEADDDGLRRIFVVVNPDKLRALNASRR